MKKGSRTKGRAARRTRDDKPGKYNEKDERSEDRIKGMERRSEQKHEKRSQKGCSDDAERKKKKKEVQR